MLSFTPRGLLQPSDRIQTSLENFKITFVDNFPDSKTRLPIFEEYQNYLVALRNLLNIDFVQWVNGSFVTNKLHPNDIDFVTLLDISMFDIHNQTLENQFGKWRKTNFFSSKIDAYFLCINEKEPTITTFDKTIWHNQFTSLRKEDYAKFDSKTKGYIELAISQQLQII